MLKLTLADPDTGLEALPNMPNSDVEEWRDNDGMVCAYGYTLDDHHWMHLPGLASFRFRHSSDEVVAFVQPSADLDVVRDSFYRGVLPMALQARGQEVLHASGIRTPGGIIALSAVSETGKSTLAYGLSKRGYPLWADDAVALESSGGRVQATPLPFSLRLRPESVAYYGYERGDLPLSMREMTTDQVGGSLLLAAIFVLERAPDAENCPLVEIDRLAPLPAFSAVLKHAYCYSLQDIDRKRLMINYYTDLVKRVPVLRIRFQPGLERLPLILDRIEQAISSLTAESV
jgi:hypothetical protein